MKNQDEQVLQWLKLHPEREPREEAKEQFKKELRRQVNEMKRKKSFINITKMAGAALASIAVILIVVLIFFGNSKDFLPSAWKGFLGISDNEIEQSLEDENEEIEEIPEELYVEDTSKEGIEKLFHHLGLQLFEWSPDGKKVIFSKITFEDELDSADLYIWVVGANRPKKIESLQVSLSTTFVWSPDSEKVIVSLGTSTQREAFIVNINNLEIIGNFVNFGIVWSPDSSQIAFAILNNDVPDNGLTELPGSLNLAIYDFEYGITQLLYGTDKYYYMPKEWTNENTLKFFKYYFDLSPEEQGELNPKMKHPEMILIEELSGLRTFAEQLSDHIPQNNDYTVYKHANYILYCYLLAIYYELEDALEQTREYIYPVESFEQLAEVYKKNVNFNTIRLNDVKLDENEQIIEYDLTYTSKITNNVESFKIKYDMNDGSLTDLIK